MAVELGIVTKSGSWFSYGDMRLGQGRENCREFLKQNTEICNEIEHKIREQTSLPGYKGRMEDENDGKDSLDE